MDKCAPDNVRYVSHILRRLAEGGLTDNPNPKANMSDQTVTPTVAGKPKGSQAEGRKPKGRKPKGSGRCLLIN